MGESDKISIPEHETPSDVPNGENKADEMVNAFEASSLNLSTDDNLSSPSPTQSTEPSLKPQETTKTPDEEAEELKEKGNTAFKAKNYGTAIDLYTRALELNPKEATYLTNRAASHIGLKRFKPALFDCQEAVALQSPNPSPKTLVRLARCQLALGSASACLSTIRETLEREPRNSTALQLQFKALQLEGHVRNLTKAKANKEWAMAGLALGQCIQITEGEVPIEWRCWRIEIELGRRNFDAATAAAVDALRFDSNSADVVALRGLVLFLTAELSGALKHAISALRLDPDHAKAKSLRVRVKAVERLKEEGNKLFKSSQWESAIEKYGEALDVVGEKDEEGRGGQMRATLLSNRATALLKLKRYEEALSDTNASLVLYKGSFKALRTRARIHLHLEKYEESITDFKEAIDQVKIDGNSSDERSLASELRKAEAALKRSKTKDYYKILGVARDCTEVEIKKAYRRESLKHHPDKGGDEEKFKVVVEAHAVLSDPQRRERYDNGVDEDGTTESRGGFGPGMQMSPEDYADIFGQFGGFQFRQGPGSHFGF